MTYFRCARAYLVSQLKNHAPRNPIIKPINGLSMANQSEIASPEAGKSRLRMREGALLTGKSVAPTGESSRGNPYRELIVFMPSRYR
jgi:hypothetical protein